MRFSTGPIADERWFLDQLADVRQVDVDSKGLGRELFMTWDQVRQLADSDMGLTIGSHAHSHRKLAGLDDNAQRDELTGSKQILEARLGRQIKALAYPLRLAGYLYRRNQSFGCRGRLSPGVFISGGINRHRTFDRYEVNRLGVGSADSAALLRARSVLHAAFGKSFL